MTRSGLPGSLLFAIVPFLLLHSAHAQTTTDSASTSLITDANFIGYSNAGGSTWQANYCPSSSDWYQTGTWARCCPTTTTNADCSIWTRCSATSIIFESGGATATCSGQNSVCRTAFISQDSNDQHPFLYVGCGTADWTAYRTPPVAVVKTITASDSSTILSTSASSIATGSSIPETQPSKAASSGSSSKAWIAGVVIGPIALALVAGLLFYIYRLKKKNKAANPDPQSSMPMMGGGVGYQQRTDPRASYNPDGAGYAYQQPYDQQYTEHYGDAVKQPYDAQPYDAPPGVATGPTGGTVAGTPMAPVELTAEQAAPVEVPAEPMSPKRSGDNGGEASRR